jgi:membrane protease YdiL (CAAX protease family)
MAFIGFALSQLAITYRPWKGTPVFYLLNIIAMFICCIGEEIGWRGFLLPLLYNKYSLFKSSIIVGILWGVWHLNFNSGLTGFLLFTVYISGFSVIMSWIYAKTKGNMNLMILLHFCFNLFSHVFLWNRFVIQLFVVEAIVFTLIAIVIVICNQKLFFNEKFTTNEITM